MCTSAYYATFVDGLSRLVTREITGRLCGARIVGLERDRVYFDFSGAPGDLLLLRTVENVYARVMELDGLEGRRGDLPRIEAAMRDADLGPALELHRQVRAQPGDPSFRITATRTGDHEYVSQEVAAAGGAGVVGGYGWRVDLKNHDIDIWVQLRGAQAVVGMRLCQDSMSRRSRVRHGPASLDPTVAYAMCLLSEPSAPELFLDPMCGTGTILAEREAAMAGATILGSDRDERVLDAAADNLNALGLEARLLLADATGLPLCDGSVDKIACNLPWGRRIGSHGGNRRLYPRFFREVARVLRPGGRAVLVSQEKRLMHRVISSAREVSLGDVTVIGVGGLHPSIYVVDRV